jgi:hypothetical protein
MLTISGCRQSFCDGLSRRNFLKVGALGVGGLGLPDLLRLRAEAAPLQTLPKTVILVCLPGGPSHLDMYDMKPDAPAEYRGEFKPIPTSVPGIQICEHLPLLARRTDKLALVRSMTHSDVNHLTATHYLLTGRAVPRPDAPRAEDWPGYGAVLAKLGRSAGALPPFVSMMPKVPDGAPRFVEQSHGQGAGLLGLPYEPMRIDADASKPGYQVADVALHADVPRERADRRRALLRDLDRQVRALDRLQSEGLDAHYERAFAMLSSPRVASAFDLSREPLAVRERYGLNIHGQAVLQARRLVEAGVPLVTVFWQNDGITNVSVYWDTHNRNFIDLKNRLCPTTDKATSALMDDLRDRGLFDDTLIVWTGEIGRTPRVNKNGGRDHWGNLGTLLLAGGGLKMGQVIGQSNRIGGEPQSDPIRIQNLIATILHTLFDVGELRLVPGVPREVAQTMTGWEPIPGLLS